MNWWQKLFGKGTRSSKPVVFPPLRPKSAHNLKDEAKKLRDAPKETKVAEFTMRIASVYDSGAGVMVAGSPQGTQPLVGSEVEIMGSKGVQKARIKDVTKLGDRVAYLLEGIKECDLKNGDLLQLKGGLSEERRKEIRDFDNSNSNRSQAARIDQVQQDVGGLFSPGHLDTIRKSLDKEIKTLRILDEQIAINFWNRGPIVNITGVDVTINAVITKLKEEEELIRQYVANIKSLSASVRKDDCPNDHLSITMSRHFCNGDGDVILHHIFRTGKDQFQFAYMRL